MDFVAKQNPTAMKGSDPVSSSAAHFVGKTEERLEQRRRKARATKKGLETRQARTVQWERWKGFVMYIFYCKNK